MYRTFGRQMSLLPADARRLLSAAGVLLPRPFTFSQDLITAASGLTAPAARQALEMLAARGYLGRTERAGDGGRKPTPQRRSPCIRSSGFSCAGITPKVPVTASRNGTSVPRLRAGSTRR